MRPSIASGHPVLSHWRRIPGPPRDPVKARLLRLHVALARHFGPQRWWPARTAFEVAAGAVLVQFTTWTNAARAVAALRARGLLNPARMAAAPAEEIEAAIRPAGTYRLKATRLRALTAWLLERFDGRFDGLRAAPLAALRRELRRVPGIGPETADVILLYAAHRPVFVVDAYTRRILARHRLLPAGLPYEEARRFLESHLPSDPWLFNEYHALLVTAGKRYCRAEPRCTECPLRFDLAGRPPAR